MSSYLTQPLRKKHGIVWQEEYLLWMLDNEGSLLTNQVLDRCLGIGVMSLATAHKYLTSMVDRKYVEQKRDKDDKRNVYVNLTDKGINFLKEIRGCYD
jgi:DNA-binding MarR family transcriptional regulator